MPDYSETIEVIEDEITACKDLLVIEEARPGELSKEFIDELNKSILIHESAIRLLQSQPKGE